MRKYKVFFTDNTKLMVRDLRYVQTSQIRMVKERRFLIFWKKVDWKRILKELGKEV